MRKRTNRKSAKIKRQLVKSLNLITKWIQLLRPVNIVLITATPALIWAALVIPLIGIPLLNPKQILLLGFAIGLVAAAGNIINDIFDRTIDKLNNQNNPINNGLPLKVAWITYVALNLLAFAITYLLAAELNLYRFISLMPISALLLFGYSSHFKCVPFIGNLIVSLFCAGVPAILLIAEPIILENFPVSVSSQSLLVYIGLAFFGTMAREMTKDLEDKEGDAAVGCKHLGVILPEKTMMTLIQLNLAIVIGLTAYLTTIWVLVQEYTTALSWGILGIIMILNFFETGKDYTKEYYGKLSTQLKLMMAISLFLLILNGVIR